MLANTGCFTELNTQQDTIVDGALTQVQCLSQQTPEIIQC